MANFLMP